MATLPNRIDCRGPTNISKAKHPLLKPEIVRRSKHRKIAAQETQELILIAECQGASDLMQAVCAYDKIKCPRWKVTSMACSVCRRVEIESPKRYSMSARPAP